MLRKSLIASGMFISSGIISESLQNLRKFTRDNV
jgi:hypothetical protein